MDIKKIIQTNKEYKGNNRNIPQDLKANAQKLCWEYNQTGPDESEKRKEILHHLFGSCSNLTFIEPSFRCDYGFNIHIHAELSGKKQSKIKSARRSKCFDILQSRGGRRSEKPPPSPAISSILFLLPDAFGNLSASQVLAPSDLLFYTFHPLPDNDTHVHLHVHPNALMAFRYDSSAIL